MRRREWIALFAFVLFWRLCHAKVLWIEEAYPMTGAIELLSGRWPYRDFWFDKPPGAIFFYSLFGASSGWILRLVGASYVFLCCFLASKLGGRWAAWLLGVYLSLGIPSAVIAIAPDLLLVAPHLAAVWLAQTGRPWGAGLVSGAALLIHSKGLLVLAAALIWSLQWRILAGFAATLPIHFAFGAAYWQQVWEWGRLYSSNTFVSSPLGEFGRRTLNWLGFQSAAVLALQLRASTWIWRWWAWCALGLVSVTLGLRFFPRYYFFLLVPVVVMAGKAMNDLSGRRKIAVLALLLIPAVRFGPRNIQLLLGDETWDDLALFRDSQSIAFAVEEQAKTNDTLFVWGYRPDISALARLNSGMPFIESQPIDCIFADRHLLPAAPMQNAGCEQRWQQFRAARPTWLVDGLGPMNPRLRLEVFFPLVEYELIHRTHTAILYRRINPRNLPVEARRANPVVLELREDASHRAAR